MITSANVLHMITDDLDAASAKLDFIAMELLSHKNDLADMFSGSVSTLDAMLTTIGSQVTALAKDLEAGLAGGPTTEDPRVRELAEQLRKFQEAAVSA